MQTSDFPLMLVSNVRRWNGANVRRWNGANFQDQSLNDQRRTKMENDLAKTLEIIETALKAGEIANPWYQSVRSHIAQLVHDGFSATVGEFTHAGKWESLPRPIYEFSTTIGWMELHSMAGKIKKIEATKLEHPLIDAMRAYAHEVQPLGEAFTKLKGMVVKRVRKEVPAEDQPYTPPPASSKTVKAVFELLKGLCQDSAAKLHSSILANRMAECDRYADAQNIAIQKGDHLSPRKFAKDNRFADIITLQMIFEPNAMIRSHYGRVNDWMQKLETATEWDVRSMLDRFVTKTMLKLASIFEAKDGANIEMLEAKIISREIRLDRLEGELAFQFADGSSFMVSNSVVWSYSVYGKAFTRFPLTFHNVVLPGGNKMSKPSEERMNTVFLGLETK